MLDKTISAKEPLINTGKDMLADAKKAGKSANDYEYAFGFWGGYITYNLDAESGDTTLLIEKSIPKNAKIRSANGQIIGGSFEGRLADFSGTTVTVSGIEYQAISRAAVDITTSNNKAFVIDFGAIRKLSALRVVDFNLANIVLVLPWMGIEFGDTPLYPYSGVFTGDEAGAKNIAFPETETAKLLVQFGDTIPSTDEQSSIDNILTNLSITSHTMALNTRVAVGNRPPFHTFSGELKGEVPLPEFSGELNAYLDEVRADGAEDLQDFPLMITMDAPGVIEKGSFDIVYDLESTASWGDSPRQSLSFERQGTKQLSLVFPAVTSQKWRIHKVSMEVVSDFPQWRTFPDSIENVSDKFSLKTAADFNIAQSLIITETTELFGLSLFVFADEDSEILLEIQGDDNGLPDEQVMNEETVSIRKNNDAYWLDIMFSVPLSITAGKNLWFVIKSKTGSASMVLINDTVTTPVLYNRNGAGFKELPYSDGNVQLPVKQFRKPAVGEIASVITLSIDGESIESDLPDQVATLALSFLNAEGESSGPLITPVNEKITVNMDVTVQAAGNVTFQNVVAQYQYDE